MSAGGRRQEAGSRRQKGEAAAKGSPPLLTAEEFSGVMRKKRRYTVFALAAAFLWVILLGIFPLPFYSLFFASNLGSNLLLVFMAAVVVFPLNWAFSKALKADIANVAFGISNIILLVGVVYVYSIFRYSNVLLLIGAAAVHWAVTAFIFYASKGLTAEKGGAKRILWGVVCAALSEFLYLLMFTLILNVFRD